MTRSQLFNALILALSSLGLSAVQAAPWQVLPVLPSEDAQESPDIHGTVVTWQQLVSEFGDYDIYVADVNDMNDVLVTAIGDAND